jgi:ribosomal protein L40E
MPAEISGFTQFTEQLLEEDSVICRRCGALLAVGTDLELHL